MPRATVLIPSHAHGPLLEHAAGSALAQTVEDLEVFIVLDGADEATADSARRVSAGDDRVTVFENPKGERHGEAHRHTALVGARGRIVCYLSDDDLWLPDHVAILEEALATADFTHTLAGVVGAGGSLEFPYVGHLGSDWYRDQMARGRNFIPLSTGAHTLALYRNLATGWVPAPPPGPTDLFMWLKLLHHPGVRATTTGVISVIHFPSPDRREMTLDARRGELAAWADRVRADGAWRDIRGAAVAALVRTAADLEEARRTLEAEGTAARSRAEQADRSEQELRDAMRRLTVDRDTIARDRDAAAAAARDSAAELAAVTGSIAYRAARRLAATPLIGPMARWAGRALAGRADR